MLCCGRTGLDLISLASQFNDEHKFSWKSKNKEEEQQGEVEEVQKKETRVLHRSFPVSETVFKWKRNISCLSDLSPLTVPGVVACCPISLKSLNDDKDDIMLWPFLILSTKRLKLRLTRSSQIQNKRVKCLAAPGLEQNYKCKSFEITATV